MGKQKSLHACLLGGTAGLLDSGMIVEDILNVARGNAPDKIVTDNSLHINPSILVQCVEDFTGDGIGGDRRHGSPTGNAVTQSRPDRWMVGRVRPELT